MADFLHTRPILIKILGVLGTLTAILMVYFGVQAGRTLHSFSDVRTRVLRWVAAGIILVSAILNLNGFYGCIVKTFALDHKHFQKGIGKYEYKEGPLLRIPKIYIIYIW